MFNYKLSILYYAVKLNDYLSFKHNKELMYTIVTVYFIYA